jgi:cyclopropane fatty-acyl-phospholipid synthase-like methyltransferase
MFEIDKTFLAASKFRALAQSTTAHTTFLFLDLGCGTGYSSMTIAECGFRVVGIELSWDMIHQHPSDFAISVIQADMRHLPLRSQCIDHLISISAFNFVAEGGTTKTINGI